MVTVVTKKCLDSRCEARARKSRRTSESDYTEEVNPAGSYLDLVMWIRGGSVESASPPDPPKTIDCR